MHPCPSCQATLQIPPHDLKADAICDRCGGVWLSATTLKATLQSWRIQAKFVETGPSADFCPSCGPVPLDEGTLLGQDGLHCSSCRGVFMRKALKYERTQSTPIAKKTTQTNLVQSKPNQSPEAQPYPSQTATSSPIISSSTGHSKQQSTPIKARQQKARVDRWKSNQSIKPKAINKSKAENKSTQIISSKKTKSLSLPKTKTEPPTTSNLDFNKSDAAWIMILLVGIIISLSYWMNP